MVEKVPRIRAWELLQVIYKTTQLSDYEKAWAFLTVIKKIDSEGFLERSGMKKAANPSVQAIINSASNERLDIMLADVMTHIRPDVQGAEEEAALVSIFLICRDRIKQVDISLTQIMECTEMVLDFINRIIESKHLDEKS
jgi:hypothetical protein